MSPFPDIFEVDADGEIRFRGHRIRLIDVASRYVEGHSAEGILIDYYPTLSLAQIYRAIAYYLENEADVTKLIQDNARVAESYRATAKPAPSLAELRQRLEARRRAEAS
jgi:uncharacterized protein (DUF433 family)